MPKILRPKQWPGLKPVLLRKLQIKINNCKACYESVDGICSSHLWLAGDMTVYPEKYKDKKYAKNQKNRLEAVNNSNDTAIPVRTDSGERLLEDTVDKEGRSISAKKG
jgi:hypothetical protein